MNLGPILLTLGQKQPNDPPIEAITSLGYLRELREQLERTAEWDHSCVVLEIAQQPKMVGRIGAYISGTEYDKISGGELGPSYTPYTEGDEKTVPIIIELGREQMLELAAMNEFGPPNGPYHWTTKVSDQNASEIVNQIDEVLEKVS